MRINYHLVSLAIFISALTGFQTVSGQGSASSTSGGCKNNNYKTNWTVKPFDYQIFIENKGQFTADLPQGEKILYGAQLGDIYAFITNHGLVYKFTQNSCMRADEENPKHYTLIDPDDYDASVPSIDHYLKATWEGSTGDVSTIAAEQQTYYHTYPKGKNGTIIAHVFKKVTCRNVYPGIDVEYMFPDGKDGIKYNFIVHPGADASLIKLKYDGATDMTVDNDGDIKINTGWGDFMDHAPVSFYQEDHTSATSSYKLNNNEETFSINNTDASKTLVIDPWSTNWTQSTSYMSSSGYDGAYDVDYDYQGNVYVYGGYNYNQLAQYSPSGVKNWVYITSNFAPFPYYGDFCVDKASGVSFALQGFNSNGALVDKISVSGALLLAYPASSSEDELWRATYDLCDHIILIAGGGSTGNTTDQAATLDTNLTTFTMANVMNTPPADPYHDMALIACDPLLPVGYMASTHSTSFTNPNFANNDIYQFPLPGMVPDNYTYQDNYAFQEVFSISYVGPGTGNANGMNGMAVSPNWFYTYDGKTLEQHVKATGNLNASATLPGTSSFEWGGLDVDLCDDVYVGNQTSVDIYNSNLAQTGTIGPFSGNVYDVVLGNGTLSSLDSTLYVCGKGFLSSIKISPPNPPTLTKQRTHVCSCNCTAALTLNLCGSPDTSVNVTYQWSNGQTTHWATGLCPGNTYTCTVHFGCSEIFQDTVNFPLTGALTVVKAQTNTTCAVQGTASVTVAGGMAPYTYAWSPNNQTTAGITGLSAGDYCVTITDNKGCQDSACFIISSPPMPTITVPADTVCLNTSATLTSTVTGGQTPYVYLWSDGSTNANDIVSPAATTTYTATVTDANGCSGTTTVQVVVNQPPSVTIAPQGDTICAAAGGVIITATPVGTGPFVYSWAPANSGLSSYTVAAPMATPTVTTVYTVTVTDANGCMGTATTTVYIAQPPTINVTATRVSICNGSSTKLIASATNVTSPFTWQPGNLTGPLVQVTPSVTTTYTVSASSGCGTAIATITVNVNQLPSTSFSVDAASGCAPLCVQFRNKSTSASGSIVQWNWNFGNGDSSGIENPIFCYSNPGSYNITLTTVTDSGCSSTLNVYNYINAYSRPNASFSMSPQPTTILQSTIQFTDQSTDAYGLAYWTWNFGVAGNDTLSYLQNPSYYYWDTGTYCPTEVVMNIHGCMDTVTNCLVISPIFSLYIPDAFTPNGDGKNDVFMATGNDVKSFEMYIFDRWGEQLFHSTDINNGWDGSMKGGGTICQEDTYVYLINAYDNKNQKHSYLGKVNLVK